MQVAFCITLVALPIIASYECLIKLFQKASKKITKQIPDCELIYTSGVYASYQSQMQSFAQHSLKNSPHLSNRLKTNLPANELQKKGINFIKSILQLDPKTSKNLRESHKTQLTALRDLLKNKDQLVSSCDPLDKEIKTFLDELTYWLYTSPFTWDKMIEFFKQHVNLKTVIDNNSQSGEFLEKAFSSISFFNFGGVKPQILLYDPHLFGDVPSHLFTIDRKNNKKTKIIRTANVTKDLKRNEKGHLVEATVVEEFENYLEVCKDKNKTHLYVNLMERCGSEKFRSTLIEELENAFPNTFHAVTLDKDSTFYHQKGCFLSENSSDTFKKTLLEYMFEKKDNRYHFYWPSHLNLVEWKTKCQDLIEEVHVIYFATNLTLAAEQRREFIEHVYIKIIESLIEKIEPDTCNISCKSCVDRGPSQLTSLYVSHLTNLGQSLDESEKIKITSLALAPAMLAQNRPINQIRIPLLKLTVSRIIQNNKAINEDIDLLGNRKIKLEEKIHAYIDKQKWSLSPRKKEEYTKLTLSYFARSENYYGPVTLKWVDYLLTKADKERKKLVFLARDGIPTYKLARKMLKKDPTKWANLRKNALSLAFFSRSVILESSKTSEGHTLIRDYIEQLGIQKGDRCIFADIGWAGSAIESTKKLLHEINIDFEYLVTTQNSGAHGYLATPKNRLKAIPGSAGQIPATHWLEDTHQGTIVSPKHLLKTGNLTHPSCFSVDSSGKIIKKRVTNNPLDYLLRTFGQKAIKSVYKRFKPSDFTLEEVRDKFDDLLVKLNRLEVPLLITHI